MDGCAVRPHTLFETLLYKEYFVVKNEDEMSIKSNNCL
jgi:hypothetical protein